MSKSTHIIAFIFRAVLSCYHLFHCKMLSGVSALLICYDYMRLYPSAVSYTRGIYNNGISQASINLLAISNMLGQTNKDKKYVFQPFFPPDMARSDDALLASK